MKSIKKRFKSELAQLRKTAEQLLWMTSELSLLDEISDHARLILNACRDLEDSCDELRKEHFIAGIAEAEALTVLEELCDADWVSGLENRIYRQEAAFPGEIDAYLQQLVEKLEKQINRLSLGIQQLLAVLEEKSSDQ